MVTRKSSRMKGKVQLLCSNPCGYYTLLFTLCTLHSPNSIIFLAIDCQYTIQENKESKYGRKNQHLVVKPQPGKIEANLQKNDAKKICKNDPSINITIDIDLFNDSTGQKQ